MDGFGCDDIDECAEGTDQCDQNCHNNIGSYTCSCNTGYRLNADGFRCDGQLLRHRTLLEIALCQYTVVRFCLICIQISMSVWR